MKSEILHLLRNADGYISGQQLCEAFGVSRTAVWKAINQLKEEGYVIDSVQNKGYRITEYPDIITDTEIRSLLIKDSAILKSQADTEQGREADSKDKMKAQIKCLITSLKIITLMIISLREYSSISDILRRQIQLITRQSLRQKAMLLTEHYLLRNVRQAAGDEEEEAGSHLREQEYG